MSLLEAGLAAWRLARMAVREAGPNEMLVALRRYTGIEYDLAGTPISWPSWNPLHCVYCTGLYTAALMLVAPSWARRVLAVAGVAALLEAAVVEREVNA